MIGTGNLEDEVVPEVSFVGKEVAVKVSLAELQVDQRVHRLVSHPSWRLKIFAFRVESNMCLNPLS